MWGFGKEDRGCNGVITAVVEGDVLFGLLSYLGRRMTIFFLVGFFFYTNAFYSV